MPAHIFFVVAVLFLSTSAIPIAVAQESKPSPSVDQSAPGGNNGVEGTDSIAHPGVGPGHVGGVGGGAYRVGGGVEPPKALYAPDPVYSDEARHAHLQGTVVLWLVVAADGMPQQIRVQRSLGKGLDEAAIAAVRQWKFQPATRNGQPVRVMINVEVNFRLFQLLPHPDSAAESPLFPGVKTSKYPLIVHLSASSFRGEGSATAVTYKARIVDGGKERTVGIFCTLSSPDCLSFQDGTYPARWKENMSGLEILGVLGTNGKWQKTEYAIVVGVTP